MLYGQTMVEKLADGFQPVTEAAWRAEVERTTKGLAFEKLQTRTEDGLVLQPVYLEPGSARPELAEVGADGPWGIRQPYSDPDLHRCNRSILRDLQRGVSQIALAFDAPTRRGEDPDRAEDAGRDGLPIASVDDLDLVLAGVMEDLAPISLDGVGALPQAALLIALWQRRSRELSSTKGSLGFAPLSSWAALGHSVAGPDRSLADAAELVAWCRAHAPLVRAARADELPFHEAGASDAQGLGLALAELIAIARACDAAGQPAADCLAQLELQLALDVDVFGGIAKLRAARLLLARVAELLGRPEAPRAAIVARLGRRSLTRTDPWVNLLRGTAATFAAAVGGAEAMVLEPFDAAFGVSDELGRRLARNTQVILQEESALALVADPAGGSGYVEARTDALAEAAWGVLQAVEAEGGLAAALASGWVHAQVADARQKREARLQRRARPLTGVTEFPDVGEKPLERPSPVASAVAEQASHRLALTRARGAVSSIPADGGRVEALVRAATDGATLGQLSGALGGEARSLERLVPYRLSESFESLRAAVRAAGSPSVFLANLGPVARHTARASFIQNLVGVGGFGAVHGPSSESVADATAAFAESGAKVAVVCGADEDYAQLAEPLVRALSEAGARVYLAGRPGDLEAPLTKAGLAGALAFGDDISAHLRQLLADHGIEGAHA